MKWVKRILLTLLTLVVVLLVVVIGALLWFHIPSNAAGMAAKAVCSAKFVAGRDADAQTLMDEDVLPASPAFKLISVDINDGEHYVTGKFLGLFKRQASLVSKRGCVLDLPADPAAVPYTPKPADPRQWPDGDAALPESQWPQGTKAADLKKAVDDAFIGEGDPTAANARGVAVVKDGQMLVLRDGKGFKQNTALHGWSMTKTVGAMLAYKKLDEMGISLDTPVVDAIPAERAPEWVAQWKADERANITVADLFNMLSGLKMNEGYGPTSQVVQMLNGEPNMASWAADHPSEYPAGEYWEYLSAVSNILAQVVQTQFPDNESYWDYSKSALFDPLGLTTATLETDTAGTWVASSYQWASVGDWARMGQMMMDDGMWQGDQVIPPGWLKVAGTPALQEGEGAGYGAQTWIPWNPVGGECKNVPGVPADTVSMEGHWGQIVAMVPSRDTVIVRMGWTFDKTQFDSCTFVADVLNSLPK